MNELKCYEQNETVVKKSRFIAEVFPVKDQTSVRSLIKEQKKRYSDARHVVHAFVIGSNAEITGCSDDGEPSGTAGRPVLDVLKGFECSNILLTVTRYFGGILLGTGGLVKAYGDAAKGVLEKSNTEKIVERKEFSFLCSYEMYSQIKKIIGEYPIIKLEEDFATDISVKGFIETSSFDGFAVKIKNASLGEIELS